MKICTRCKEPKELDQFSKRGDRSGYLNSWCKACHCAHSCKWQREHKEHRRQYIRDYRAL